MTRALRLTTLASIFSLACAAPASAQRRRASVDQIDLGRRFFAQDDKCRALLREEKWREAEAACRAAARLSDKFADQRELEKMGAYESVGRALAAQGRYDEAIRYYARALELSRPRLKDTSADVGDLFVEMALAYHAAHDLVRARQLYAKAERAYQTSYSNIDEAAEEGVEMKRNYLKALRRIYEYHVLAAEQAGATAEADEIRKRLAALPR